MVILVALTNTWEIRYNWDVQLLKNIWVSDSRTLENLWRTESTGSNDDELGCLYHPWNRF